MVKERPSPPLQMKHLAVYALSVFLACNTIAAGDSRPEYLSSFDPAAGFRPAQRDLSEIFLQIAGSLENYGSPVPYLRHVSAENARIDALYVHKLGRTPKNLRPPHLTDDYIDGVAKNWEFLSPKLGLGTLTKDVGHMMRDAIKGTRGTGTILVEIFNQHQLKVSAAMAGKNNSSADFETLKTKLIAELELDKTSVDDERYAIDRRDAVSFALGIHGVIIKLFKRIDKGLGQAEAEQLKTVLTSIILDVGRMAQSELELGIAESALSKTSTVSK